MAVHSAPHFPLIRVIPPSLSSCLCAARHRPSHRSEGVDLYAAFAFRSLGGASENLVMWHLTGTAQSSGVRRWRMWCAGFSSFCECRFFLTRKIGKTSLLNVFTRGYFTQV